MPEAFVLDNSQIQQWIDQKMELQKIEELLREKGLADENINIYIKEYKRQRYGKQQAKGFILTSTGAFLGFISCLLTVFNPIPELYNIILFGLTSFAILLIFIGLYLVFE
jgi:hypothetical protein